MKYDNCDFKNNCCEMKQQLNAALERETALKAVWQKMQGGVEKCPFHDDDVALCIQYNGQAPCITKQEAALAAHVERMKGEWEKKDGHVVSENDKLELLVNLLYGDPCVSLARRDLIKQAEALELVNCQSGPQEDTPQEDAFDAGWAAAFELIRQFASELRQRAQELAP